MQAEAHIFKAIDIRGIYGKDIDEEIMERVGSVLADYLKKKEIIISSDFRISSPSLRNALIKGILNSGVDVLDAKELPIGVAVFYGWKTKIPVAYVTASHLPKEWNGVKFFHEDGKIFEEDENKEIKESFFKNTSFKKTNGKIKTLKTEEALDEYKKFLKNKIKFKRKIKVAFDFGNGANTMLKDVIKDFPIEPVFIYDKPDGNFPNRHSNPELSDLIELKNKVKNCDIGFAFDGDGDRILVMDEKSRTATAEHYTIFIIKNLFKTQKGGVVANVECSKIIEDFARKNKRDFYRVKVGHTFMIKSVIENNACFGIEKSGHCFFPAVAPFYDAFPVAMFIASVISSNDEKFSDFLDEMPKTYFEREKIDCSFNIRKKVLDDVEKSLFKEYKIDNMDGIRIDFEDGWILIRSSNTEPILRLSVETNSQERTTQLKEKFLNVVKNSISSFS